MTGDRDESSAGVSAGVSAECSTERVRPSSIPVDADAVLGLLEMMESLGDIAKAGSVEPWLYRRMVQARHNSRAVEAVSGVDPVRRRSPRDEDARDLLEAMRARRSCRAFSGQKISEEHLELILEAGRWAPSAGNSQPWELLVITQDDAKRSIIDALQPAIEMLRDVDPTFPGVANPRYLLKSAAIVLVFGDVRTTASYPYPLPRGPRLAMLEQSLAMCIQNMWLIAASLGLAATNYTMGHPIVEARIREQFGVPEHFSLPTMLALGYPRHPPAPRPRRELAEMVHREFFDSGRVRSDEELIDFFYSHGVRGRGFR